MNISILDHPGTGKVRSAGSQNRSLPGGQRSHSRRLPPPLRRSDLARSPGLGRVRPFPNPKTEGLSSWKVADFPKYLVFYRKLPDNG